MMNRPRLLSFLLSILCFSPRLQAADRTSEHAITSESGYEVISATTIPTSIRKNAPSIFRIIVPDRHGMRTIDVRFGRGKYLREQVAASKGPSFFKVAALRQIADCERKQVLWGVFDRITKNSCQISLKFNVGTAFLAGSDRTLHTVEHVLENGVGFKSDDWRFYLFDSTGKLVFDSTDKVVRELKLSPSTSEFLTIELPEKMGAPLSFASVLPMYGERVYVAGYPACTGCTTHPNEPGSELYMDWSNRHPRPNSDGVSLLVSKGQNLDLAYADYVTKLKGLVLLDPRYYLFSNTDCVKGDSGGPAMNERGEVVGAVSTVSFETTRGVTERLCTFARP